MTQSLAAIVFLVVFLSCDKGIDLAPSEADISGQWFNAPTNTYGGRVTRLYQFSDSSFRYKARFDAGCDSTALGIICHPGFAVDSDSGSFSILADSLLLNGKRHGAKRYGFSASSDSLFLADSASTIPLARDTKSWDSYGW